MEQDVTMVVLERAKREPKYAEELGHALGWSAPLPKNPEALAFKRECAAWLKANTVHWNDLQAGFNTILREHFGFKRVQSLTDSQVPEARELFENYKELLN